MNAVQDRLDIIATCSLMAWLADHRDWDRLGEVFTQEAVLDYTSLNGGEPVTLTPTQIGAAWSQVLGKFDATQHVITNHLVTVDGDTAVCTAYFQATHVLADRFGAPTWTLGGTYRFDLTRAAGDWRIRAVVMTATWGRGNRGLIA
ncbi:nuclear transport factor 2 family protein [Nocardia sp. NPDC004711]